MNESTFSRWLIGHFRDNGAFVQRLEVTTGSGVPDLVVIYEGKTHWVELKWNTNHIRPEQYVWARNAAKSGVLVNYICGYEDRIDFYAHFSDEFDTMFKPMTNTFKLIGDKWDFPRTKIGAYRILEESALM